MVMQQDVFFLPQEIVDISIMIYPPNNATGCILWYQEAILSPLSLTPSMLLDRGYNSNFSSLYLQSPNGQGENADSSENSESSEICFQFFLVRLFVFPLCQIRKRGKNFPRFRKHGQNFPRFRKRGKYFPIFRKRGKYFPIC